jgi:hypothetical protein
MSQQTTTQEIPKTGHMFTEGIPPAMVRAFMGALRSKEEGVQRDAAEALVMVGGEVLERLVNELTNKRRTREFRLRLLTVIQRIGPNQDPKVFGRLALLGTDPDLDVREAAAGILFRCCIGPEGPPTWQERRRTTWSF